MKNTDKSTFAQLIVNNIVCILLGTIAINLWAPISITDSVIDLFTLQNGILTSFVAGFVGSLAVGFYIFIIRKAGKGNLPNTETIRLMVSLTNHKKLSLIGLVLLPAVVDEFLFRGGILTFLEDAYGPFWGITISAVFFVLCNLTVYKGQRYLLSYIFLMGIITGIAFVITESLWASIFIHLIGNYLIMRNILEIDGRDQGGYHKKAGNENNLK